MKKTNIVIDLTTIYTDDDLNDVGGKIYAESYLIDLIINFYNIFNHLPYPGHYIILPDPKQTSDPLELIILNYVSWSKDVISVSLERAI